MDYKHNMQGLRYHLEAFLPSHLSTQALYLKQYHAYSIFYNRPMFWLLLHIPHFLLLAHLEQHHNILKQTSSLLLQFLIIQYALETRSLSFSLPNGKESLQSTQCQSLCNFCISYSSSLFFGSYLQKRISLNAAERNCWTLTDKSHHSKMDLKSSTICCSRWRMSPAISSAGRSASNL